MTTDARVDFVDNTAPAVDAAYLNNLGGNVNTARGVIASIGQPSGLAQLDTDGLLKASQTRGVGGGGTPQVNLLADFTHAADGTLTAFDTGQAATLTRSRSGADPLVASGRLVSNDVAAGASASYFTGTLSDSTRMIYFTGAFEMTAGSTSGQVAAAVLWTSNLPSGLLGAATNTAPIHLPMTPTGYIAQWYDSAGGGANNVASVTYGTAPGTAVQPIAFYIDTVASTLTITAPDGVTRTHSNSHFASIQAFFATCEHFYTAASTDGRVKWRTMGADSVVGGRVGTPLTTNAVQTAQNKTLDNTNTVTVKDTNLTIQDDGDTTKQVKVQASGITTGTTRTLTVPDASGTIVVSSLGSLGPVHLPSFWTNAWAAGIFGIAGYIDRARTFTKIRYVPAVPNTGTFTVELRDINTGSTFSGTSGTSTASVKYKEVTGTFTFAAGDMPYPHITATTGTAGLGCDVWLIP